MALFLLPNFAAAQEVLQDPICFMVVNTAPHKVYGNIGTDRYTAPDGTVARHRSNFRLDAAGSTNPEKGYPTDRAEFCSYGPFYPGLKLEFVIRTLFPVFSCKTKIDQGPIIIKSTPKADDPMGGVDMSAACFE